MTVINYTIGQRVRSYDFPGRQDCFVEGKVIDIQHDTYYIKVDRRVVEGAERPLKGDMVVMPPLNGLATIFGKTTQGVFLAPLASAEVVA